MSEQETPENKDIQEQENEQDQETPEQQAPKPESIFADQLSAIQNEQGVQKYNTVEDALKGAANAQEYIRKLKQEMQEKEELLNQREQALEKYKGYENVLNGESSEQNKEATTSEGLDEQKAAELFESLLTKKQQQEAVQRNLKEVNSKLVEQYGSVEKAKEAFESKAQDLGMGTEDLNSLASKSPKAVLEYFKPSQQTIDVKGSRRTEAAPNPEDVNWSIFSGVSRADKLRAWRAAKPQT